MSDWKPGEIALVTMTHRSDGESKTYGPCIWNAESDGWVSGTHGRLYPSEHVWRIAEVRPLVVIDAEDREAVERLWRTWADLAPKNRLAQDNLQAALREFANPKPPKPEEPTGLGAVVEDADGERWVRATNYTTVKHWRGCDNSWQGRRRWDEIRVVRILNDGVQP